MNRQSLLFYSAPPARRLPAALLVVLIASATFLPRTANANEPPAHPPAPKLEQIQQWIKELGDDDFQTREAANEALYKAMELSLEALKRASETSEDPEVRDRAARTHALIERELFHSATTHLLSVGGSFYPQPPKYPHTISLRKESVTDDDMIHVARLRMLTHVYLDNSAITDQGLARLRALDRLQNLSCNGTEISDAGLLALGEQSELTHLSVTRCKITDNGLSAINSFPGFKRGHSTLLTA